MKHTFKEWFTITRYWSFPVSAMPVAVATAFLAWKGYHINWLYAVLALLGNVIFHAAGNLLSDWWDYRKGVDNEKAHAVPFLVFKMFNPSDYTKLSTVLFAAGLAIGLILTWFTGWQLLIIGGIGFLLALTYSFFKFRALGDIFVFFTFGVLPVIGTSFVAAGTIDWSALVISLPLGLFTVAVLHDNNTVDIATDSESGIKTVPMFLGEKASALLYIAYMVIPYICVTVYCVLGALPWFALLCLISGVLAFKNAITAAGYFSKGREALIGLDQKTAQLHMVFSILMIAGLVIATLI